MNENKIKKIFKKLQKELDKIFQVGFSIFWDGNKIIITIYLIKIDYNEFKTFLKIIESYNPKKIVIRNITNLEFYLIFNGEDNE